MEAAKSYLGTRGHPPSQRPWGFPMSMSPCVRDNPRTHEPLRLSLLSRVSSSTPPRPRAFLATLLSPASGLNSAPPPFGIRVPVRKVGFDPGEYGGQKTGHDMPPSSPGLWDGDGDGRSDSRRHSRARVLGIERPPRWLEVRESVFSRMARRRRVRCQDSFFVISLTQACWRDLRAYPPPPPRTGNDLVEQE